MVLAPSDTQQNLPGVICVGGTNMCDQRMDFLGTIPTNSCNYDNRLDYISLTGGSDYGIGLGVVAPGINEIYNSIKNILDCRIMNRATLNSIGMNSVF